RATDRARDGVESAIKEIEKEGQSAATSEAPKPAKESPSGAQDKETAKESAEVAKDRLRMMLDQAEKNLNLTQRDDLYQEAAFFAFNALGNTTQALEIADRMADDGFRQEIRSWLAFEGASRALGEQRFDDARRFALEVQAADQRAFWFTEIANVVLKEKG